MNKTALLVCSAVLSGMLSACISVDYKPATQKTYPALAKDARVEIFYEKSKIPAPAADQTVIGNCTASTSTSSHTLLEVKRKLMKYARENGANVVLIENIEHKQNGQVRSDQLKNQVSPAWTPVDTSATSVTNLENTELSTIKSNSVDIPTYRITVKAQFIKIPDYMLSKLKYTPTAKPVLRKKEIKQEKTIKVH